MESFFFLFFFIFFLILWFALLRYSSINLLIISIPSILITAILIYQYLGYPILFFSLHEYRAQLIQDRNFILEAFFITNYTIAMIILGFILARKNFGTLYINKQHAFSHNMLLQDKQLSRYILYLLFIFSSLILFYYISKIGLNNIASLVKTNFFENNLSIKVLRSNMGSAFEGKYHWYRIFMRDFLSITSVALYGIYLLRKKFFYLFIFIISFFINVFSTTMATEKAPLLWYLISLFFMYILVRKDGRFKVKYLIVLGFIVFFILGVFYLYFMSSSDIFTGMQNALTRVLTGQLSPLYHYLEAFPQHIDFYWGRSLPNPGGLLPFESISLSKEVHNFIYPDRLELGIVGSMPTFFWGEMFANFGYMGIIIPPFFIGYLLYGLEVFLIRFLPNTPIILSIYIWIIIHYKTLSGSSLSSFIIDLEMFCVVLFLIFIIWIQNNLKLNFKFKQF